VPDIGLLLAVGPLVRRPVCWARWLLRAVLQPVPHGAGFLSGHRILARRGPSAVSSAGQLPV